MNFLLLVALVCIGHSIGRVGKVNCFDPLFSYDDGDAHKVSVGKISRASDEQQKVITSLRGSGNKQPEFIAPSLQNEARFTPTFTPLTSDAQNTAGLPPSIGKAQVPQHWTALKNFYQKIKDSSSVGVQSRFNPIQGQPEIYQILQDPDDRNFGLLGAGVSTSNSDRTTVFTNPSSYQNTAFYLPMVTSHFGSKQNPSFNRNPYSAYDQMNLGVGKFPVKGDGLGQDRLMTSIIKGPAVDPNTRQVQIATSRDPTLVKLYEALSSSSASQPRISTDASGGQVRYFDTRKLPDYLVMRLQQERARHQQETLGSLPDQHRYPGLNQLILWSDDAFCGPRNYVKHSLTIPGFGPTDRQSLQQNLAALSKISMQTQQLDVPVALTAGEFPSHMGIYNGSTPSDDNFLCSATWIHEKFALTLASCVKGPNLGDLSIKAGEWNSEMNPSTGTTRSSTSTGASTNLRPTVVQRVKSVAVFPKYRGKPGEHDLALIELETPILAFDHHYIYPACQSHTRSSLRANFCWAPVRNISRTKYFDADGEGETKEHRTVKMIEMPIKLIAHDDPECYKQTLVDSLNFQHPNLICSPDFRDTEKKLQFNQTEYAGSGIYCDEGGNLSLVSMLHPITSQSASSPGFIDLSYYRPWIRNQIMANKH